MGKINSFNGSRQYAEAVKECLFTMSVRLEFRMGQYRDDDHWEDASHFTPHKND